MKKFSYRLVVECETLEEAEAIIGARLGFDEELEGVGDYQVYTVGEADEEEVAR